MAHEITRRRLLRGSLSGAALTLGLPILDMVLNDSGTAFAETNTALPVRFGTWLWGCGMNPDRWVPKAVGDKWEMTTELKLLAPWREHFNVYTGYSAYLDGKPNEPHVAGIWALRTGTAPAGREDVRDPSFDALIAKAVGGGVRFRALDMAATGAAEDCFSTAGGGALASPELTPLSLYLRVFGPGFHDPNSGTFTPDPDVLLRRSVLSSFGDERAALLREASIADKEKLDRYFTSVRELEQQLSLQLEKPAPALACSVPKAPAASQPSTEIEQVIAMHKQMVDLTMLALLCHQTKVFNIVFSPALSTLRKSGSADTHHMLTHQEPFDNKLGCQPESTWFAQRSIEGLAYLMERLASTQEGSATLMDNVLVHAHSDTSIAKIHSIDEMPVLTLGRAGGKIRSGLHIREDGGPVSRTVLTAMHAMGVKAGSFGTKSLEATQPISGVLV